MVFKQLPVEHIGSGAEVAVRDGVGEPLREGTLGLSEKVL